MLLNKFIIIKDFRDEAAKMHLNLFTLSFKPEYEKPYIKDSLRSSILIFRMSLIFGIILYGLFAILDKLLFPELVYTAISIRFLFTIPVFIIIFTFTFHKSFYKFWQISSLLSVLVAGIGILAIIFYLPDYGKIIYYMGIMLVLIFNYLLVKIRFIWASLNGLFLILLSIFSMLSFLESTNIFFTNNLFFLVSTNIMGMFGCYILEYYSRRNFYLQRRLLLQNAETEELNKTLDRKVYERTKDLKERELHYKSLIENAADAIYISDYLTNIIDVNQKACEQTGFSKEELLSMKTTDLDEISDLDLNKRLWKQLENGKQLTIERLHKHKNGLPLPVEITLGMSEINTKKIVLGFVRDISERKKADSKLFKYQNKLEELVKERTLELEVKNQDLEEFNNLFIGREFRIKELKNKIAELEEIINRK